jgi:hypothetical protein
MSNFTVSVIPCSQQSPIIPVSSPQLTIPPPSQGSTIVLDLSALGLSAAPSVTLPANVTQSWSAPNLTVALSSSFTGGTIIINWTPEDNGSSPDLILVVNSALPVFTSASSMANLAVNADSSFFVTSMGANVTLTDGVTSLVEAIPSGGQVQVIDAVFFMMNTSNPDVPNLFSLTGGSSVSLGTITNLGAGLELQTGSTNTVEVSNWTALNNSQVTVNFTVNQGTSQSLTFTVVQSSDSGTAAGGTTNLMVNNDGLLVVTALSSGASSFTGIDLEYQTTTAGNYTFSYDPAGISFNGSQNLTFVNNQSIISSSSLSQSSTGDSFTDTNTAGNENDSAVFTIATNEGILDPTIVNNPDT